LSHARVRSTTHSARQELKAGVRRGAFDDLDGPVAEFDQGGAQGVAIIDAVGKEMAQL
jgi:hypothetical protein